MEEEIKVYKSSLKYLGYSLSKNPSNQEEYYLHKIEEEQAMCIQVDPSVMQPPVEMAGINIAGREQLPPQLHNQEEQEVVVNYVDPSVMQPLVAGGELWQPELANYTINYEINKSNDKFVLNDVMWNQ